ncbi:MAG: hypothetical protein HOP29_20045 [Phycisphaerales bacterium]|nr:hypothetical protein [Phycisphaerales bacterium]
MADMVNPRSLPGGGPSPLDSAHQLLADALRTSFRILKIAMVVLVIAYFASGLFTVEQNRQAVVLRLGRLAGPVRNPGVHWAFPPPIDQVIEIPVQQSTTLTVDSHWLYLTEEEKKLPLASVERGRAGLHPMRDGALLTGDKGLVHIKWRLTYRVEDLEKYVSEVADEDYTRVTPAKAERIITKLLERAAIDEVGGYTTEDATRKRLSELRDAIKRRVNEELAALNTGVFVGTVEIPMSTPPLQTKLAFDEVIRAESRKESTIRDAEQKAAGLLNETAGAAHAKLVALLDERDGAARKSEDAELKRLDDAIHRTIVDEASGAVGSRIRDATGYYSTVVEGMRADYEEYETLLPEWQRSRDLLVTRLWERAKQQLFGRPGITKLYRPAGAMFRIVVGPDPKQRDLQERQVYEQGGGAKEHEHEAKVPHYPGGPIG